MSIPWDWIASGGALLSVYLYGNRTKWAPISGLVNQVAWVGLAIAHEQWGLLVSAALFTIIHIRNLRKFTKGK